MAKFTSIDKQSSTDASKEKKKNHSLHVINHILVSYLPALRRVKDNAVRFRQPKKINFASDYARKLRERRNRGAAKETRASESSSKSSGMTKRQPLLLAEMSRIELNYVIRHALLQTWISHFADQVD